MTTPDERERLIAILLDPRNTPNGILWGSCGVAADMLRADKGIIEGKNNYIENLETQIAALNDRIEVLERQKAGYIAARDVYMREAAALRKDAERMIKLLARVRDDVADAYNYALAEPWRDMAKVELYYSGQLDEIDAALAPPQPATDREREGL